MAESNYLEAIKKSIKTWPGHRGKQELVNFLDGETLGRADAMLAYCYGCMAGYTDKNKDCELYHCPMYPYQPYGSKKPESGRKGKTLSPEHLAKMQAARRK